MQDTHGGGPHVGHRARSYMYRAIHGGKKKGQLPLIGSVQIVVWQAESKYGGVQPQNLLQVGEGGNRAAVPVQYITPLREQLLQHLGPRAWPL